MIDMDMLKPGDVLTYKPKGVFGWIISVKTWHMVAHVEIYAGNGQSYASRDGIGVGYYKFRKDELRRVMRPKCELNLSKGIQYFNSVNNQKYDWVGLLGFVNPKRKGSKIKQFCSEFVVNFLRACDLEPFPGERADKVAPFQLEISNLFDQIYPTIKSK